MPRNIFSDILRIFLHPFGIEGGGREGGEEARCYTELIHQISSVLEDLKKKLVAYISVWFSQRNSARKFFWGAGINNNGSECGHCCVKLIVH